MLANYPPVPRATFQWNFNENPGNCVKMHIGCVDCKKGGILYKFQCLNIGPRWSHTMSQIHLNSRNGLLFDGTKQLSSNQWKLFISKITYDLHYMRIFYRNCSRYKSMEFKKNENVTLTRLTLHPGRCGCYNSLRPSDAIWWQKTGSTLTQVMACCLTAPSHYLNQCWLIINEVQWHSY